VATLEGLSSGAPGPRAGKGRNRLAVVG
jgi:hypothetical protein